MAAKKTITPKPDAPAPKKTEDILVEIDKEFSAQETAVKEPLRGAAEKIPLDEDIPCRSITFGGLTWVSPKTNFIYRFADIAAVEYIPFGELITLFNPSRKFITTPLFVIMDARVVEYFRLRETYERVAEITQLDKVFQRSIREIEESLDRILAVNMRGAAVSKVRQMRHSGQLTNIDVIRLIERKLGFDLSEDHPASEG